MVDQPQANPKPHPVDYIALILLTIGAAAQAANEVPAKYAGFLYALAFAARIYTKWIGSQQQAEALSDGKELGQEIVRDIEVTKAVKAEKV